MRFLYSPYAEINYSDFGGTVLLLDAWYVQEKFIFLFFLHSTTTEATAGRFSVGTVIARCSFDDTTIGSPGTTCEYIDQYAQADRPFQYAESSSRGDTGPNAGYNAFGTYHSDQAGAGARGGVGVKINQSMIV